MNQQYTIMTVKNGVLKIIFKAVKINLKAARKIVSDRLKLQNEEALPVYCDIRNLQSVDIDAREYFAHLGSKLTEAVAIVAEEPYSAQLARIYIMASKPVVPTAIFTNQKDAYEFLNQSKKKSSTEIKRDPATPLTEEDKKLDAIIGQIGNLCAGDLSRWTMPSENGKKTRMDTVMMALNMVAEHFKRQPSDSESLATEISERLFFLDKNMTMVGHSTGHEDPIIDVDQEALFKKSFLELLTPQSQQLLIEKHKELKQSKKVSFTERRVRLDIKLGDYEAIPVTGVLEKMASEGIELALNIYYNSSIIDLEKKMEEFQPRNYYADIKATNEIFTTSLFFRVFQRVKHFSAENIYEMRPSFEDIVAESGTIYHNFDRIFKRHHGVTIKQYHTKNRFKRLAKEIGEGKTSLLELASKFGYEKQGSLSRAFKRQMGCSPQAFKKLSKSAQNYLVNDKLNF